MMWRWKGGRSRRGRWEEEMRRNARGAERGKDGLETSVEKSSSRVREEEEEMWRRWRKGWKG